MQFLHLREILINIQLAPNEVDPAIWKWNESGQYTTTAAYLMINEGVVRFSCTKGLWRCWAPLSCKLFMWLTRQFRLWTSVRSLRHGLQDQRLACFPYDQEEDTVDHILLQCMYLRQIWLQCVRRAKIDMQLLTTIANWVKDWWCISRKHIPKRYRKGFYSLVILVCWNLLEQRNGSPW